MSFKKSVIILLILFMTIPFIAWQKYNEMLGAINSILILLIPLIILLLVNALITRHYKKPLAILNIIFSKTTLEDKYKICEINSISEFEKLSSNYNVMIEELNRNLQKLNIAYEENKYIATHDQITGLLNRIGIEDKIKELLDKNIPFQIHYIDIDNFKIINEIYGHSFGDLLLKKFANKLMKIDEFSNTCARIGGDEFFIVSILKDKDPEEVANTIQLVFLNDYFINDIRIDITGSIGITLFPNDDKNFENIMKNLDLALFKAKSSGKNKYCFFDEAMRKEMERENQIKEMLNCCIDKGEIYLVFQPEVETQSKRITGFESLLRIRSECLGNIEPSEFVPIAESSGLIFKLGWWILEKACIFIKRIVENEIYLKCISVNISTLQLIEKDFCDKVLNIIKKVDIDPKYVQLEITETTLMSQMDMNIEKLDRLRNYGITIALDDFGTSYSSLNYLINLPIDVIKIDKSFIDEICETNKKQLVTRTIIDLSHNLGIRVVAEGIEDEHQFNLMKKQKCDLIQGYYFSRPMLEEDALNMIKMQNL